MKKAVLVVVAFLCGLSFAVVSPQLEEHMRRANTGQRLGVHIVLREQFDATQLNALVEGMPKPQRRMTVARILSEFSAEKQAGLVAYLKEQEELGNVRAITPLWIVNAVYCEATPTVIAEVGRRADVNYVDYDLQYSPDLAAETPGPVEDGGYEIAWGVSKINAPAVWALGYTGAGIVCGHIDTGCNYNHPDLADHMWTDPNYPNHGWNFENNNNDPNDAQGHGTHTAGTVASDGTSGTQAGVAPDANMMICRVRTVADSVAESQCWQAMQFCVSPPLSPANGADLYTMSLGWQLSWNPKQATWRTTANNVNAAGLIQVVAAGNERSISPPNSCRCPGNVPPPWWNPQNTGVGALSGIMSIGATDASDNYASFSSRGPVTWATVAPFNDYAYPPGLTRPDMSAPGVDVKSCSRTGGYTTMSGTSMATPHVAGTVCLMLSKNPHLSPAVVDSILEITAVDRGPTGKDNDYGAGRIDALAAVNHITGSGGPMLSMQSLNVLDPPPGGNGNGRVDPGETANLEMTLRNSGGASCNNTVGTLRSGDSRLVVSDPNGTWGNIPPGGSSTNSSDRFTVQANSSIPQGTSIPCTLHVTGDSAFYAKTFVFGLVVGQPPTPGMLLMDHDTGYCKLTVSCQGSIGYDLPPADMGSGFCYPKSAASALFYGSVAVGNAETYVADRHFSQPASGTPNTDLVPVDSLRPVVPPAAGDEHFRGSYSDAGHPSAKGLKITQNSYQVASSGYDDFVVVVTDIANNGSSAVNGLYAGVFADFDVGSTPTANVCSSDVSRRFTFMRQSSSANPCVGVKILAPTSYANLAAVDHARYVYPDSAMTDGMKWRFLNGTVVQPNSNRAYDWSVCVSVGPFDLPVGASQRFAFAFCGGTDGAQVRAHADSAQSWYDRNVGVAEERKPVQASITCPLFLSPNPFSNGTFVHYFTAAAGAVELTAYDASGREVERILFDADKGSSRYFWQPRNLAPGIYFLKVKTPERESVAKVLLLD